MTDYTNNMHSLESRSLQQTQILPTKVKDKDCNGKTVTQLRRDIAQIVSDSNQTEVTNGDPRIPAEP